MTLPLEDVEKLVIRIVASSSDQKELGCASASSDNYVEVEANNMGDRGDAVVGAASQAHQGDGYTGDKDAEENTENPAEVAAEVAKALEALHSFRPNFGHGAAEGAELKGQSSLRYSGIDEDVRVDNTGKDHAHSEINSSKRERKRGPRPVAAKRRRTVTREDKRTRNFLSIFDDLDDGETGNGLLEVARSSQEQRLELVVDSMIAQAVGEGSVANFDLISEGVATGSARVDNRSLGTSASVNPTAVAGQAEDTCAGSASPNPCTATAEYLDLVTVATDDDDCSSFAASRADLMAAEAAAAEVDLKTGAGIIVTLAVTEEVSGCVGPHIEADSVADSETVNDARLKKSRKAESMGTTTTELLAVPEKKMKRVDYAPLVEGEADPPTTVAATSRPWNGATFTPSQKSMWRRRNK